MPWLIAACVVAALGLWMMIALARMERRWDRIGVARGRSHWVGGHGGHGGRSGGW